MNTQRQKKRTAQFKKKRHDGRGQEAGKDGRARGRYSSGGTSRDPGSDRTKTDQHDNRLDDGIRTEQTHTESRDTATLEYKSEVPLITEVGEQKTYKKYSRRKVTSNWSRYEEEVDGGLEESDTVKDSVERQLLQERLVQLLNLPTATAVGPDSSDRTETVCVSAVPSVSSPLSLDCDAIAKALDSLPVYEKLDIDLELLELAGEKSGGDAQLEEKTTQPPPPVETKGSGSGTGVALDLTSCSTKHREQGGGGKGGSGVSTAGQFDFWLQSKKSDTPNLNVGVPVKRNNPTTQVPVHPSKGTLTLPSVASTEIEPDDVLEQLLVSEPTSKSPVMKCNPRPRTPEQISQTSKGNSGVDSELLDDMLDELLA